MLRVESLAPRPRALAVLVGLPALGFALACGGVFEPRQVIATDGSSELTVPFPWSTLELNDVGVIEVGNGARETYALVVSDDKADVSSDMQSYSDLLRATQRSSCVTSSEVGPTAITLDGSPGLEYVVSCSDSDGVRTRMIHTTVDGQWSRFQVVTWTLDSRWARNEATLRKVQASFHERQPASRPSVAATGSPLDLPSADGTVRLQFPPGWIAAEGLSDEATIQAKQRNGDAFAVVISEAAEDYVMSLDEYAQVTREMVLEGWDEGTAAEPEQAEIGGHPAVRTELRGVYSGVRVIAIHTAVRTETGIHQVLVWTFPSKWESRRAEIGHIPSTLRELRPPAP